MISADPCLPGVTRRVREDVVVSSIGVGDRDPLIEKPQVLTP